MPNYKHPIFLSYSHKDAPIMERVKSTLLDNKLKVWTDEDLIPGTPVWEQAIEKAIESAGCLTVVLSPNAKASIWVRQEIGYARIQDIPIFPVLADGKENTSVPLGLTYAHWTDIRDEAKYESEMQKLITAIANHLGITEIAPEAKQLPISINTPSSSNGVFISYRRSVSRYLARAIFMDLITHSYDVFMDVESIDSGDFQEIILDQILNRAHFLVLLSPGSVEGFSNPDDWFRREIERAIDLQRNIVPILVDNFNFQEAAKYLTGKLEVLPTYNGLPLLPDYFEAGMDRLRNRFLKLPPAK